jgi:hypothetical protein
VINDLEKKTKVFLTWFLFFFKKNIDRDFQTPLLSYKQEIFQMPVMALVESDPLDIALRETSLIAIREMVLMRHFLKKDEVNTPVSIFTILMKLLPIELSFLSKFVIKHMEFFCSYLAAFCLSCNRNSYSIAL